MDENYGSAELVTLDWLVRSNDDYDDNFYIAYGVTVKGA